MIVLEKIYSWNKSLNSNHSYDYRIFFAEQYLNVVYLLLLFPLYLINTFFWSQINFLILFAYGLNFIFFRLLADVGSDQITKTNFSKSEEINSTLYVWKLNKKKLSLLISKTSDNELKDQLGDKLEFSSFLNSEYASDLINKGENLKGKDLDEILKSINNLM